MKRAIVFPAVLVLVFSVFSYLAAEDNSAATSATDAKSDIKTHVTDSPDNSKQPVNTSKESSGSKLKQPLPDHQKRWENMSPEKKQELRRMFRKYQRLSPEEKETMRAAYWKLQHLPSSQRTAIMERIKKMPPEQRQHLIERLKKIKEMPPARKWLLQYSINVVKQLPDDKRKELESLSPEKRRQAIAKIVQDDLKSKAGDLKYNQWRQLPPEQCQEQIRKFIEERRIEQRRPGRQHPNTDSFAPKGKDSNKSAR